MPTDPQSLYARGLISDDQMVKLRDTMTHNAPPQPPNLQPYIDTIKQFAHGGISEVLQNRGQQPDWMKAGDFLHSDAANVALGMVSPIGKATEVAAQLKDALGTERFQTIISGLQDADKGHVLDVAKEFMGQSYPSKIKAISKMQSRHNELMNFQAKQRFMAGRSAG